MKAVKTKHTVMPHHVALLHQIHLTPSKAGKRDEKIVWYFGKKEENAVAFWSWAYLRADRCVGPCRVQGAELLTTSQTCVSLGQSSSGGWKQQQLPGRGITRLTATPLSSLPQKLPFVHLWTTPDWRKGYKMLKRVPLPHTPHKNGGEVSIHCKSRKKYRNITSLLPVIGWEGFNLSESSPFWLDPFSHHSIKWSKKQRVSLLNPS